MRNQEAYRRLQAIFIEASDLEKADRAAFLDAACADDPELRAEVEEMLAAESQVGTFLESPVHSADADKPQATVEPEHRSIGPYRLQRRLGAGGMGVVYLAEQIEPVRRQVALKLIKTGMDTERVVARFEMERQALAMMEHPGIARVLDAGATENGRPYFVMEIVRGIPITDYCTQQELNVDQKLQLFCRVCDALHHAHQKGIIHRDIKPSNVLVEGRNGEVSPKIIDFGIAKATNPRLSDSDPHTKIGQIIGTPEYMSPEQAETSGFDIDTRSDIYSMGVMLYRLLAGILPFDTIDSRSAGLDHIHRLRSHQTPPVPSSKVSSTDSAPESSGISSQELRRKLKGDLDWIVMKAIDRDPARRYQSASEFAADIRRHLNHEPVLASPPSTSYRIGKFVRRHRAAVAGSAGAILLLVAGIVTTTSQAIRATRAEREARHQAALAADVNDFLIAMLAEANPENRPAGVGYTVSDALDTAVQLLESGDRSPQLEAEVRRVVGNAFYSVGRYENAKTQTLAAIAALEDLSPSPVLEIAKLKLQLANILVDDGALDDSEEHLEDAREIFASAGEDHLISWGWASHYLGDVARMRGDASASEALNTTILDRLDSISGDEADRLRASAMIALASVDINRMELERAERRIRAGIALQRATLGEHHPRVADTQFMFARLLSEKGEFDRATALYESCLETTREIYGAHHLHSAVVLNNFGLHLMSRDPERAEGFLHEVVAVLEEHGNEAAIARSIEVLAAAQMELERFDEAEASFLRALEIRRAALPDDHPDIALSLNGLGSFYMRTENYDRAVPMLQEALGRFLVIHGERSPQVAVATYNLGSTLSDAGRLREAVVRLKRAVESAASFFPEGHLNLAVMQAKYGQCLARLGRFDEAEELLVPARATIVGQLGDEHWRSRQANQMIEELEVNRRRESR